MPFYDALLFDFDGVLADTEPLHWECWREVLLPLGIDLDWDTYRERCIGVADTELLDYLCRRNVPPVAPAKAFSRQVDKQLLFQTRALARPPISKATCALVADLAQAYRLAVVTSSDRSEVEPLVEAAGIRPCFQAFVAGKDVRSLKPAPDPYQLAARLLNARKPLVIEDSDAGESSGQAAGFDVLRVSQAASMPEQLMARLDGHVPHF